MNFSLFLNRKMDSPRKAGEENRKAIGIWNDSGEFIPYADEGADGSICRRSFTR